MTHQKMVKDRKKLSKQLKGLLK